jgi:predicted nucleic acid-binding protein
MARSGRAARSAATPSRLILDSGAVIALARRDVRVRAYITRALEVDAAVLVPPVVVAETTRGTGPRDAPVNRVLHAVGEVPPTTEATARVAGALLAAARSKATVDALVVAEAVQAGGGRVLTGDPADLRRLATAHAEVRIEAI